MSRSYTKEDILNYLDNCVVYNPGCFFMDLEHGYFYTANSRLSLFASDTCWAIVFEKSGFANRSYEIQLELNFFGDHLRNLEPGGLYHHFNYNSKYFTLVDGDALSEIEADVEQLSTSANQVRLRGKPVSIPNTKEEYAKWIPDILSREYPTHVAFQDVGRFLAFEYADECRATMDELRTCLPDGPPSSLVMHIDEWHHRAYNNYGENGPYGDKPSSYETFPLIADVLVSGDAGRFQPSLPPTSHWSNWSEAGGL